MPAKKRKTVKPSSVKIEVKCWDPPTGRGTTNPGGYPFTELKPAKRLDNKARGSVEGESFFIPPPLNRANSFIQRARYIHKPITFVARQETVSVGNRKVTGLRVWKIDPAKRS